MTTSAASRQSHPAARVGARRWEEADLEALRRAGTGLADAHDGLVALLGGVSSVAPVSALPAETAGATADASPESRSPGSREPERRGAEPDRTTWLAFDLAGMLIAGGLVAVIAAFVLTVAK